MESLDLTYKLITLTIKSKTLDRIYFMSQVFQEHNHCYDRRRKLENENYENFLFLLAPLPPQDGRVNNLPPPPNFFHGKNL